MSTEDTDIEDPNDRDSESSLDLFNNDIDNEIGSYVSSSESDEDTADVTGEDE